MNSDAAIEISVVIPTFNRHLELSRALEALAGSTFAKDKFEVMIVDDGGAKSILTVVDPFKSRLNMTLLRQFNQGAAAARNLGATQARGRFIVFTDDDCAPDPHWLESLVRALTQHPESAVGGAQSMRWKGILMRPAVSC